jgi:hypothetical protein
VFEREFWSGTNLNDPLGGLSNSHDDSGLQERVFFASGMRDTVLREKRITDTARP